MLKKKHVLILALICCLTITLFIAVSLGYDPWIDLDDDGGIDADDLYLLASEYGTSGEPINKTALLLELQAKVDSLNTSVLELQARMDSLNNTVVHLEETVVYLNSTQGLGVPDYDSGWVSIDIGQSVTLQHNLNTINLLVYLTAHPGPGSSSELYPFEEHIAWLGGDHHKDEYNWNYLLGAYWGTTDPDHIRIQRVGGFDIVDPWQYFRVRIWKIES